MGVVGLLACTLGPLWTSSTGAQEVGLVVLSTWKPTVLPASNPGQYQNTNQLFIEAATRRLYAVGPGFVGVYNVDTLQPLGPGLTLAHTNITVALPDSRNGAVHIATWDPSHLWIDTVSLKDGVPVVLSTTDLSTQLPNEQIVGMARFPGSPNIWVISEKNNTRGPGLAAGSTITELNAAQADKPMTINWTKPLNDCLRPMRSNTGTNAAIGYVPDPEKAGSGALYFGCANPTALSALGAPVPRGAARLTVTGSPLQKTTPGDFRLFPRDGDFVSAQSYWDPVSHRLTMAAGSSGGGATTYVFDAESDTYVGNISTGNNFVKQAGINPVTGRYYAGTASKLFGVVAADVRATPVTQGRNFPSLASSDIGTLDDAPAAIDPVTNRVFLRYSGNKGVEFRVVEDRLAPYIAPPGADPDENTVDVPEAPGKTEATFGSSVHGFGSRIKQIGGESALEGNFSQGADLGQNLPIGRGTRELRGAYLNHLGVLNQEAGASAISADRDRDNTDSDLRKHPTWPEQLGEQPEWPENPELVPEDLNMPGPPNPFEPVAGWPVKDAYCLDFGGQTTTVTESGSTVLCDQGQKYATAGSTFHGFSANNFSLGSSSVASSARVTSAKGSVSSITATAEDISVLAGAVKIDQVIGSASATAHGRKGTAATTWDRKISGVTVNGVKICDANCDPNAVADSVNSSFGGKVLVTFPTPAQSASPGGYQALVRRSVREQLEEMLLNEQRSDRLEVPTMVITIVEDSVKPARTRLELAAVAAESLYGISVLGADGGIDGDDSLGTLDDALSSSGLDDFGGTPLFGLPPSAGGTGGGGTRNPRIGGGSGGLADGAGKLIWNGLKRTAALFPIWAVLLAPVYLSARRWLLLQRGRLLAGGAK